MNTKKTDSVFFDSNVYINLLRSQQYEHKIEPFLQGAYLFSLNKIVLMELWAGARSKLEENILKQHQKTLPLIGFIDDGFIEAGQIMQKMAKDHEIEPRTHRRLTWDILIAISAGQNNALLVTENAADFKRIQRYVEFEFVAVADGIPN